MGVIITGSQPYSLFDDFDLPDPSSYPSFEISLLALGHIRGLGIKSIGKIVDIYGEKLGLVFTEPNEVFTSKITPVHLSTYELLTFEARKNKDYWLDLASKELEGLSKNGISILSPTKLPRQMTGFDDSPRWLFVQGNVGALYMGCTIGAVGTRQPSESGRKRARLISRILSGYDVAVVSGLAEGIDDEIHRATLEKDLRNVAFLGHGINRVFPASTASTRDWIIDSGGAVATEYFPNENFQRAFFVQRNRLQAMLSQAVIFVEANAKSGTAHTFDFARKYNRRIIGITSSGNGIDQLIGSLGHPVVDVMSQSGLRELDRFIKGIVGGTNNRNKLIKKIATEWSKEISIRDLSRQDVNDIVAELIAITHLAARKE